MSEIPATKTPRILAAMKNLSTLSITHDWSRHLSRAEKVLTVCARPKSLVWQGFRRDRDVEKLRKALEKKAGIVRGIKAGRRSLRQGWREKILRADESTERDGKSTAEYTATDMGPDEPRSTEQDPQAEPAKKKAYHKPAFRYERVFETMALRCGKVQMGPTCATMKKVS